MRLRKNDKVTVLTGKDRGQTGNVTRTLPATDMVVVDGINIVKRHTKPSTKHPRGGILELTKPLPAANVALVCPKCKKPTRIGYEVKDGHKERICRKCKSPIGEIK